MNSHFDKYPVKVFDATKQELIAVYPSRVKAAAAYAVTLKTVVTSIGNRSRTKDNLAFRNATEKEYQDWVAKKKRGE